MKTNSPPTYIQASVTSHGTRSQAVLGRPGPALHSTRTSPAWVCSSASPCHRALRPFGHYGISRSAAVARFTSHSTSAVLIATVQMLPLPHPVYNGNATSCQVKPSAGLSSLRLPLSHGGSANRTKPAALSRAKGTNTQNPSQENCFQSSYITPKGDRLTHPSREVTRFPQNPMW